MKKPFRIVIKKEGDGTIHWSFIGDKNIGNIDCCFGNWIFMINEDVPDSWHCVDFKNKTILMNNSGDGYVYEQAFCFFKSNEDMENAIAGIKQSCKEFKEWFKKTNELHNRLS